MKRVAIIGADFVPSSLPPANRVRFFAKHLPEFGWEPIVITAKPEFYDWSLDEENERLLSDSLSVIRTDAWRSDWTRKVGIGDIGMRAFLFQWRALKKLCRETNVDLVFVPVPPYVSMVLGRLAHFKFGIPYVIDYIDPWVTEYYWKVPRDNRPPKWAIAYAMSRLLEPFALKKVGHVTGVSSGTTDSVVNRYEHLSVEQSSEIPYGVEESDFDYVREKPRPNPIFDRHDGLFHMSYVGACIPGMYPTVRAIFQAVKQGLQEQPAVFERLRIHFVGTSYSSAETSSGPLNEIACEFGIENLVTERPSRVAYLDSIQIMLDSSALFLVGSDEPHYTASKVFPYMLTAKPLFCAFHLASSVIDILEGSTQAVVVAYSDAAKLDTDLILRGISKVLSMQAKSSRPSITDMEHLTSRAMTARLALTFERVLKREKKEPVIANDQERPKLPSVEKL